jgi:hypothetical protein
MLSARTIPYGCILASLKELGEKEKASGVGCSKVLHRKNFSKIVAAFVVGAVQTVQNFVMRFVIWDIYPKLLRIITAI